MRVALISDTHGNLQATTAVLDEIAKADVDAIVCLGDLIDYGASPNEVVDLIKQNATLSLCGNHDLAVLGSIEYSSFRDFAQVAVDWTKQVLTPESGDYIKQLAPDGGFEGAGLFHASPRDPVNEYVTSADIAAQNLASTDERIIFVGHTHQVAAYCQVEGTTGGPLSPGVLDVAEGRWIINAGSVGQPRDSDPRASWVLWDQEAMTIEVFRTAYDIERAQAAIRAAGLPDLLADRLAVGR